MNYKTIFMGRRMASVMLLFLAVALTAVAQKRDKTLNISVTCATGESLMGQPVGVTQTDYGVSYSGVSLNADGKASIKAYAGNHTVTIERSGYAVATQSFNIAEGETEKNISLTLVEKTRTPFAFTARQNVDAMTGRSSVSLTWNTEAPAFADDFESYDPFAISFGQWTGIDGDHLQAAPLEGDYPNSGVMQYAQIINPLAVVPMWWYSYPVLRPRSGKQYVGFVRTASGEANDDWLISPEITVGTDNILRFYAKAADRYPEKFLVYVTTKTDNPTKDDFTLISTGNYESVDYKTWHEMKYDLAQYAGQKVKIAIRYIGEANSMSGAFMLMVDDFYVGQPEYADTQSGAKASRAFAGAPLFSPANPNEMFDVYMDGKLLGTTSGYSYDISDVAEGKHTFGVRAKYIDAESQLVETELDVNLDAYAEVAFNVVADSKLTADGQKLNILSTESGNTYTVTVDGGKALLKALPKDDYMVSVEKGAFKEYSAFITVNGKADYDIILEDNVLTPYNITADLTSEEDGTTTAALRWNQNLGFTDSFEDYADFSTGEFGGWKSVDNDKLPVYPISLNGYIISFPGSGTQSSPTAIAPMVFNPAATVPAMVPTDPAMVAPYGDKYMIFFSPQSGQADKWLISPEINVYEGYDMKVTAKSYTDTYPETFEFAVSEGSDNPDDFTVVSTARRMPSDQWTEYSTPLDEYAGKKVRVGIHYTSYDTFFAQLDNVKIGPADGKGQSMDYGNVVRYDIYLDGTKAGESQTAAFTLKGLSAGSHTVAIEAVYKNQTSEKGYYTIEVSAIGKVSVEAIPADAEIYNLAGQLMKGNLNAMPHGVYVVKNGSKVMKIRI